VRWFVKTEEDKGWLIAKWIISLFAFWIYYKGFSAGPFVIIFALVAGGILCILWTGTICRALAQPFSDFYTGGAEQPDPKPFYSVAKALRAKGKFSEAVTEIQRQLEQFPGDFEGQLLLAEVQVTDLHDLAAAEATVENICGDAKLTAQNIAAALNTMADWHMKFAKDHEAARRDLLRVVDTFPGTEAANGAAQRLAHLGEPGEKPWSLRERKNFFVPEGIKNYGLLKEHVHIGPAEIAPEQLAGELVKHLGQHPLDNEAREKLALIYANHYGRLDLATGELEQMIAQPNEPMRHVAYWLNVLADLHVRLAGDYDGAKLALQRIRDRFPESSAAELAQSRIELLRIEVRAKEKSQVKTLGSYEEDIGLKYGRPNRD
jgi:tetratricopeptide (TPR) repeat protein